MTTEELKLRIVQMIEDHIESCEELLERVQSDPERVALLQKELEEADDLLEKITEGLK